MKCNQARPVSDDPYGGLFSGMIVMASHSYRAEPATLPDPDRSTPPCHQPVSGRYCDRPMDWRTRLAGMGGTAGAFGMILACALFSWHATHPLIVPSAPLAVILLPLAAPPEPVEEVPEGPRQVEQKEQRPKEREDRPMPPEILAPRLSPITLPVPPPVEQSKAADPVAETTAPKSLPAPPANRASSNAEATWEALLLAHLERYRRYPASARAARQQGVVHVKFLMNRAGRVLSASVLRSSGFAALDQAALDTLRRAQPLPEIPPDKADEIDLIIPVEFFVKR